MRQLIQNIKSILNAQNSQFYRIWERSIVGSLTPNLLDWLIPKLNSQLITFGGKQSALHQDSTSKQYKNIYDKLEVCEAVA